MMDKLTYLYIILVPGLILNLVLFMFWRDLLVEKISRTLLTVSIIVGYWAMADFVAVHVLKIWDFRPERVSGAIFIGLPVEEWILFVVSSFLGVHLLLILLGSKKKRKRN